MDTNANDISINVIPFIFIILGQNMSIDIWDHFLLKFHRIFWGI